VTPLGSNVTEAWQNLIEGKSGVRVTTKYAPSLPCNIVGEGLITLLFLTLVSGFSQDDLPKQVRAGLGKKELPLYVAYAVAAAQQAMDDSGWDGDREMAGVTIGNGIASPQDSVDDYLALEKGYRYISPYSIPRVLANIAAGYVSILHNLQVKPLSRSYS
jgi:3-oxoacyl-[acyl-carrier-protein] synthase II